jgi:signal transduction histidine kinase
VSGVTWDTYDSRGELGVTAKYRVTLDFHGLHLTLHTHCPLTPALTIHVKLLTQILGEFYEAKRREEALQQNAYMQAVYETGSRLTHDIKNIVQSMGALCSAAEQAGVTDNEQLLALVRRQLPKLNQRLALTLDKLEAPRNEKNHRIKLSTWWNSMKQRHLENNIEFLSGQLPKIEVDVEVLDSVIDNLLQNAIEKSKNEPGLSIQVEIGVSDVLNIEVCDDGKAMPEIIAEQLFKKHISSENGLGIGLYHAARQADRVGYLLTLVENRDGAVRFRLSRKSA